MKSSAAIRVAVIHALWVVACGSEVTPSDKDDMGETAATPNPEKVERRAERCDLHTDWGGDDRCIAAPAPSEGFQLHFGPTAYDDPHEVVRFALGPGEETLLCSYLITPNETPIYYDSWQNTWRPGSHHMVVIPVGEGDEAHAVKCKDGENEANDQGIIAGNTTTAMPTQQVAPENVGLARVLPAKQRVSMQLHYFNATDKPLLMEAWQNIYYKDASEVRGEIASIESIAGLAMNVQPRTTEIIKGELIAPQQLRVLDLYSHNHEHTLRFSVFLKRANESTRTQIYESYDWAHPLLLVTDSVSKNPEYNRERHISGGMSGELRIQKGDSLQFECEIQNDDLDHPLRFANASRTAEMCIMRGNYAPSMGQAWLSLNP